MMAMCPQNMSDLINKIIEFQQSFYYIIPQSKMRRDRSAHLFAESSLKENQINMLKKELHVYKDLEHDFFKLNGQVSDIEMKYAMVLDEKERVEGDWKKKLQINTNSAIQLKSDVETLKKSVDSITIQMENVQADNHTLLRVCENKQRQIQNLYVALRELQKTYELEEEENICLNEDLKCLKDERNQLEDEVDRLKKVLHENSEKCKQVEKQHRQEENKNQRLSDLLTKLEIENCQLQKETKQEEQKVNEVAQSYFQLCQESDELSGENEKLQNEIKDHNKQLKKLMNQLENIQNENTCKTRNLKELQKKLWSTEEELDECTLKKQQNKKMNAKLANENEDLNNCIDSTLVEIMELQTVNKVLQQQIENYLCVDEQARLLLDRRKKMTQLLQNVTGKLEVSGSSIAHLR